MLSLIDADQMKLTFIASWRVMVSPYTFLGTSNLMLRAKDSLLFLPGVAFLSRDLLLLYTCGMSQGVVTQA